MAKGRYWQLLLWFFSVGLLVYTGQPVSAQVKPMAMAPAVEFETLHVCLHPENMPYEGIDEQGSYRGILVDFIKLLANNMHSKLIWVNVLHEQQPQSFIKQQCDILSQSISAKMHSADYVFTQPLLQEPLVLATRSDSAVIYNINQVLGHRVAVVEKSAFAVGLQRAYPTIKITPVESTEVGLAMVAMGKVFAYIDTAAMIAYQVQEKTVLNVKIAGLLEHKRLLSIAVSKDKPLLVRALNRALAAVRDLEKQGILNQWLAIKYESAFDYQRLSMYLAPVFVVLLLLFIHYGVLLRNHKKLKVAQAEWLSERARVMSVLEQEQRAVKQSIQFSEMISHEYRTPVSIISTNLDILDLKNRQQAFAIDAQLSKMRESVAKLIALVETALSREKLLTGKLVANKLNLDFVILVEQVLAELQDSYPRRQVSVHGAQKKLPFHGDPELLALFLKNLLENAFKYSAPDQKVTVTLALNDQRLLVEVADQGIGIAHADMEYIFDKYHRAANTANTSGIGLGLYMAKLVVLQHGGEISVLCPPSGGTQVRTVFPLVAK